VIYSAELYVCVTTCFQVIQIYAQIVPRMHIHNGLDVTPLADSDINDQTALTHRLDVFLGHQSAILLFSA